LLEELCDVGNEDEERKGSAELCSQDETQDRQEEDEDQEQVKINNKTKVGHRPRFFVCVFIIDGDYSLLAMENADWCMATSS